MPTLTKSRKTNKGDRLVARVSREDKVVIAKAAALAGQSVGGFVLMQARQAALKALEARERIALNAGQSRRFVETLLAPPGPPPNRLVEAMRLYRKTVKGDLD